MSVSGASVSSHGSDAEGSTIGGPTATLKPGEDGDILEDPQTLQLGAFGVLYTISKEKQLTSASFVFFRLVVEFLQLWLLVVNPLYGWEINAKNRMWEVVSFIQLNAFLSARGYTMFLAFLYIFVGLLAINLVLSAWVAYSFSNNRSELVWPVLLLRWFGLIFYQVLDIATLTLLLVTLDCNYFDVPDSIRFHNQEFPDVMCWSMPHIIHVGVSVASIVLFYVMATSVLVSEVELNPLTRNYMAMAHTRVEGIAFTIKVIATIASVMVSSVKWLSVVYLVCFVVLLYLQVKWVPFIHSAANYVRCGSYAVVLFCSALLVALAFGPSGDSAGKHRKTMTLVLWIGMAPAALAGAAACHLRLRHFSRYVLCRFRDAEATMKSRFIYKFVDAREVEITARCCRSWVDEDTPKPEAVAMSELIIKAGMTQLPQDPFMIVLYSSFLIDVQGSYQSGYTQLQTAKKQSPGLLERFCIFSRDQEHAQKASGADGGGDSAVDLVAYVEFQRNHRLVVRAHREALIAMRSFWALLLRREIGFNHLSRSLHRIEATVKAAERAYRGVLARHGNSARLVRLYGKFLESVKYDPWAASKWYTEADRLEEDAEHTKEAMQLGGVETLLPGGGVGTAGLEGVAIICINARNIIQVASPEAHVLLGYTKNELKGKDVGVMMPPPFGDRHAAYVRNYVTSGIGMVLDRPQEFLALTKSKQVVPVRLSVSKVSGLNEDSVFLAVLEPTQPSPDEARAWVLGNGNIIAADDRFCDWLGYELSELVGTPVEEAVVHKKAFRELIKSFSRTILSPPPAAAPAPRAPKARRKSVIMGVQFGADPTKATAAPPAAEIQAAAAPLLGSLPRHAWRHKYGEPLVFDTVIHPGAFGTVRVHSVVLRRSAPPPANQSASAKPYLGPSSKYWDLMLVADHGGRIQHATVALQAALGRTSENIRSGGLEMLIPEPFNLLHGPWWRELANPQSIHAVTRGSPPAYSCRSGLALSLVAHSEQQGPTVKPFRMHVQQRLANGGGSRLHVVTMEPLKDSEALSERRLRLTLDLSGTIVASEAAPTKLFGLDTNDLCGQSIARLVDLFRPEALEALLASGPAGPFGAPLGEAYGAAGKGAGADERSMPGDAAVAPNKAAAYEGDRVTRALLELAGRTSESADCSWRVGVTAPPDASALEELEELSTLLSPEQRQAAAELMGSRAIPAIMRVRLVRKPLVVLAPFRGTRMPPDSPTDTYAGIYFKPKPPLPSLLDLVPNESAPAQGQDVALREATDAPAAAGTPRSGPGPVAEAIEADEAPLVVLDAADYATLDALEGKVDPAGALAPPPPPPVVVPPVARASTAAAMLAAAVAGVASGSSRGASRVNSTRLAQRATTPQVAPDALVLPASSTAAAASPGSFAGRSPHVQLLSARPQQSSMHLSAGSRVDMPPAPAQHQPSRLQSTSTVEAIADEYPNDRRANVSIGRAAGAALAPSLCLEVELWRADQLSGVLEVDEQGRVLRVDATCPLGQAGLVFGAATSALLGASVADLMPLPPGGVEALFEPTPSGTGLPGPDEGLRGGLKQRKSTKRKVGEPVVLMVRHRSDGCAMQLRVQAVRRAGPVGSAYLVLHPSSPEPAQPGFARWLYDGDTSGLMPERRTGKGSRRTTQQGIPSRRTTLQGIEGPRTTQQGLASAAGDGGKQSMQMMMLTSQHLPGGDGGPGPRPSQLGMRQAALAAGAGGAERQRISDVEASVPGLRPVLLPSPPPNPLAVPPTAMESASSQRIAALKGAAANGSGKYSSALGTPAQHSLTIPAAVLAPATAAGPEGTGSVLDLTLTRESILLEGMEQRASATAGMAAPSPRQNATLVLTADLDAAPVISGAKLPQPRKKNDMVTNWVMSEGRERDAADQDPLEVGTFPPHHAKDADDHESRHSLGADHSGGSGSEGGGMSSLEEEQQQQYRGEAEGRGASGDDAATGTDVDTEGEAGAHVANYGVGKRFKKLLRILTGPLAQKPARILRLHAILLVVLILVAHTATFVLLLTKLRTQKDAITDLNSVTMASRRIHEVAINGRLLATLYAGNSHVAGLTQFGDPLEETLAGVFDDTSRVMALLKEEHHGVYLGFRSLRRIPADFGLRDVWDRPLLNMTLFYDENDPAAPTQIAHQASEGLPASYATMGLWDAGNLYLAKTLDLYNNAESITAQGINFTAWATWKFLQSNGLPVIFPAYMATLDSMVQLTVQQSRQIYELQLIILCIEGGLLCVLGVTYMWIIANRFSRRRHLLYGVFIQIPIGVTRGLANMSLQLEAEGEDDDDAGHPVLDAQATVREDGDEAAAKSPGDKKGVRMEGDNSVHARSGPSFALGLKGFSFKDNESPRGDRADGSSAGGGGGKKPPRKHSVFTFWRSRAKVMPTAPAKSLAAKAKRRLVPSHRLSYALVSPFILWGVIIIIIDLIGYNSLRGMSAPIATLNVVNEVLVRFHRVLYYTLEVAGALSVAACGYFKGILADELALWRTEVAVMLFGNGVLSSGSEVTSAAMLERYHLATTGVLFGGTSRPSDLLYHTGACLAADQEACQPEASPYYQATRNGLDVLLKAYFSSVESLITQPDDSSGLNSTEFNLLWATGQQDLEGGLSKMSELFVSDVQNAYDKVEVQQIALFVIAWVWALAFLVLQLRPFMRQALSEARRIAELLSQLPSEVDVEGLVTRVMMGDPPATAIKPAGRSNDGSAHFKRRG